MRGPLLPGVRHLDSVCLSRLHQSSGPGCTGQQPSHRGELQGTHLKTSFIGREIFLLDRDDAFYDLFMDNKAY